MGIIKNELEKIKEEYDKSSKKKILCCDFDGVINSYKEGISEWDYKVKDKPVDGIIEMLQILKKMNWRIIIFSARITNENSLQGVKNYLKEWNIPYDEIFTYGPKPYATVYLDDRALNFSGDVDKTFEQIINFKPWM